MTNKQLTYIRAGASAFITLLAVMYSLYPSYTWITAVIAAAATLGIHAIPSVGQSTGGITTMSEQPVEPVAPVEPPVQANPATTLDGSLLMGVSQPVAAPVAPEAPETLVDQPAAPVEPAEAPAAPVAPVMVRTAPTDTPALSVADRLRALAAELDGS